MSLPAAATLSQVRDEVFTRCTLNTGGDRGSRALKLVDSMIRRAQRELAISSPWLRLSSSVTINLVTGQTAYDFPDEMDPGRYMELYVRNTTSQAYYPVTPDPSQGQRNGLATSTMGRALFYWFNDGQLYISPSPDTDSWDQLRIDGYLREGDLIDDEALVAVDSEALIQRAEIFVRPRIGQVVTQDMKDSHLAYVRQVRSLQGENPGTMAGGDTSSKCIPQDGPGFPRSGYAYDTNWQPPGYWGP
jgi:hypothetical protein